MITIPIIVIPWLASIILFFMLYYFVKESIKGTWDDTFAFLLSVITFLSIPFVWTLYFTVLYFLK